MTVELVVACVTGVAVAGVTRLLVRPPPRLAPRLRPYTVAARTALGGVADVVAPADGRALLTGAHRVLAPMAVRAARAAGRFTTAAGDEALARKLRHSGLLQEVPAAHRLQHYRTRQLSTTLRWTACAAALGLLTGVGSPAALALALLGLIIGATRWPVRVNRAIDRRKERMRFELYTVNQVLALQVRAGSGVIQALQHVVHRGSGALVEELAEVLALQRGGRPLAAALEHAAASTPEPNAARTYRLLANGVAYGADLADGLRTLSDELRHQRADALRRAATKRRAAMLVPIIAILAPVMLLFIAAPLPALVLGSP
jgi:tight adherence protein C